MGFNAMRSVLYACTNVGVMRLFEGTHKAQSELHAKCRI